MPACQAGAGRITAGLRTRPRRLAVDLPVFKPAGRAGGRMDAPDTRSLPENAYQPLAPGETYAPIVPATTQVEEATVRSVGWGLFLCIVFTVASAYSGLKVGQVMEASIPISILAIGLARTFRRRSTLLENVILTNIGGTSGGIVAGAIFTLPALYILHLDPHPVQTTFILLAGGCLGWLFLIPLRRYFVRETHGQFPYPEATAITEVLVTGEKGGSQAALLLQATAISGVYDFFVTTFQVWRETLDFQFIPGMRFLADRAKLVLRFDAISFILGLGYVMGLRSSAILCAGGALSNLILVPLIWYFGRDGFLTGYLSKPITPGMDAGAIFRNYVRFIAVGAIATAGIFGILKSLRLIRGSFALAAKAFKHGEEAVQERVKFLGILASAVAAALTIVLLAKTFQFGEAAPGDVRVVLASPQASIMKALVQGFMSQQPIPYALFAVGAVIAIVVELLGIPPLIFALGMYLPLELNTPALVGGFLSHWLNRRSETMGGEEGRGIRERGVIIASGLMVGGALGGVFGAALRLFPWYKEELIKTPFFDIDPVSQIVSALLFLGLCFYLWYGSLRRRR